MRLDITGRHVDVTPALRQLITTRLKTLERVLNDAAVSALVIVTKEKYRHKVEMVIHARGDHTLSGNGEGTSWPLAMRQASQKIEHQAQKLKGKWKNRTRSGAGRRGTRTLDATAPGGDGTTVSAPSPRIVRATRYAVKPMSIEDAAMRLDDGADTFLVFRNADDDALSILYRRKDGNLGLIEPD
jgi:putative sigma-54 modulation protein